MLWQFGALGVCVYRTHSNDLLEWPPNNSSSTAQWPNAPRNLHLIRYTLIKCVCMLIWPPRVNNCESENPLFISLQYGCSIYAISPGYNTDDSNSLIYRSPNLPDKMDFCHFQCFSLKFSPFFPSKFKFFYSLYGFWDNLHVLDHWQRLFHHYHDQQILIFCTSCKTWYNVLSHSHVVIWRLG